MPLKTFVLLSFLILSLGSSAQNMKLISYRASNGIEYKIGSKVYLGTGTNEDRSFNYARRASHKLYTPQVIDINTGLSYSWRGHSLPASWSNQTVEVKRIRQVGAKKKGYVIYLICSERGIRNFWIAIEAAIITGEVINPKSQY